MYDGNYRIYENGVLIYDANSTLNSSAFISIPATYVYNLELHLLIQLLGVGQPGWTNVDPNYTNLEYIDPDYIQSYRRKQC